MAGTILGQVFDSRYEMIDGDEVSTSVVDIALRDKRGLVHAVEVTRHEVPSLVEWSELLGKEMWSVAGLNRAWHLSLQPGCKINGLRAKAVPLLRQLERLEISQRFIHPYSLTAEDQPFIDAGIRSALVLDGLEPGTVLLGEGAQGSSISIDSVAEVVVDEKVLAKSKKLGRARADVRDLFVWVGASQLSPWLGLSDTGVPSELPTLPTEIDFVWVTSWMVPSRLLRCSRKSWEEFESGLTHESVPEQPSLLGLWDALYPGVSRPVRRA